MPCNASFIQLDRSQKYCFKQRSTALSFTSISTPGLAAVGIIPSAAIASHGWGIDGKVDDLFYKAALGYDDNELFSSMQSLLRGLLYKKWRNRRAPCIFFAFAISAAAIGRRKYVASRFNILINNYKHVRSKGSCLIAAAKTPDI